MKSPSDTSRVYARTGLACLEVTAEIKIVSAAHRISGGQQVSYSSIRDVVRFNSG
jgi:hypothetical protein